MKTIILSFFCLTIVSNCNAQAFTSLNENFDVSCVSVTPFPGHWTQFAVWGLQTWQCSASEGINGSPCMTINDYTTTHNIDTQVLYTPKLDLGAYTHIYFNFFDRYSRNGDSLGVFVTNQNGTEDPLCDSCSWTKIVIPFSADDTVWRMHQIDLTPYKAKPVYVAFKYTSSDTSGSIWYIDSVFTSVALLANNVTKENVPLTVLGMPGSDAIQFECTLPLAGSYQLVLYDIMGRVIKSGAITRPAGTQRLQLNNLNLRPGMYLIKLGNATCSGFAKAAVQ